MPQQQVANWITKWIWQKPLSRPDRAQTWIALDEDTGDFVGYGTWEFVDAVGARHEKHIEIAWFGVDSRYQGETDDKGRLIADSLYATIETIARGHPDSTDDMPLTLVCHVENRRGRRFWERQGYRLIQDADAQVEKNVYHRMVR